MDEQAFELMKGGADFLAELYRDSLQPSVRVIGNALGTVCEYFSWTFLSNMKYKNAAQKLNFKKWMYDYARKLNEVPEENVCDVKTNIGVPIIEKLAITTEDEIADLFTTLLASASNKDKANTAHPSFVNIIARLSVDEARIIKYLQDKEEILYCSFRGILADRNKYRTLIEHATTIPKDVKLDSSENINIYFENLVSQGILSEPNDSYIDDVAHYEKIKEVYGFGKLKEQHVPNDFVDIEARPGYFHITDLGKMFIKACIK